MTFLEDNQGERNAFIDRWAEYVCKHPDKLWSQQQNVIINGALRGAKMTKENFFKMKQSSRH